MLIAEVYNHSITWRENDGNENFIEHTIDDNLSLARFVYATDMDDDNDIDVLGIYGADVAWWENDGNENFTDWVGTKGYGPQIIQSW